MIDLADLGYPGFAHLVSRREAVDLQNHLSFGVALARQLGKRPNGAAVEHLREQEASLERSRIGRVRPQQHTEAERRWPTANRSEPAAHWNVLSNLTTKHLRGME